MLNSPEEATAGLSIPIDFSFSVSIKYNNIIKFTIYYKFIQVLYGWLLTISANLQPIVLMLYILYGV